MNHPGVVKQLPRNAQRTPTIARPGRLAQLARAPPLQGGGHWFESSNAHNRKPLL